MSCSLCGHEEEGRHHLGCVRITHPDVTDKVLREAGLLAPLPSEPKAKPDKVEVLREGSMTTEPVEEDEPPAEGGETVEQCEVEGCDNPKYSASARAKYCADHKDPKNR